MKILLILYQSLLSHLQMKHHGALKGSRGEVQNDIHMPTLIHYFSIMLSDTKRQIDDNNPSSKGLFHRLHFVKTPQIMVFVLVWFREESLISITCQTTFEEGGPL